MFNIFKKNKKELVYSSKDCKNDIETIFEENKRELENLNLSPMEKLVKINNILDTIYKQSKSNKE